MNCLTNIFPAVNAPSENNFQLNNYSSHQVFIGATSQGI